MFNLFMVGIFEMLIVTAWTETVTRARVLASGAITMVNIFVWYYVLETIINNISNSSLVLVYALGCAIGTMLGTYYIGIRDKRASGVDKITS